MELGNLFVQTTLNSNVFTTIAGPCRISDANGTKYHPESWNSNANIFFLDQPVGVGFSYADHGEFVVCMYRSIPLKFWCLFRGLARRLPKMLLLLLPFSLRTSNSFPVVHSTWRVNHMGWVTLRIHVMIWDRSLHFLGALYTIICVGSLRPECQVGESGNASYQSYIYHDRFVFLNTYWRNTDPIWNP